VMLHAPTFSLVTAGAVRQILDADLATAKELVAGVYLGAAGGGIVNPPSLFLRPEAGRPERFIALPAAVDQPGPAVGLKWIGSFPGNVDRGLPRASAVVVLNDPVTGFPVACLEGAVISATRTALSAVVGAEALVALPGMVERLAVIGAGVIARRTVEAFLACGWRIGSLAVFDLRADRAAALAGEPAVGWPGTTGIDARAVDSPSEAVDSADLVLVATTATSPWLDAPALTRPGATVLHLSLRDLTAGTMAAADHVVDDPTHAAREGTSLELAIRHAGLDTAAVLPIGALLSGAAKRDPDRAVIYSPFGLGALDVALADLVLTRARERGLAIEIPGFFGAAE
jgi:2,3-diaminopropionate biosynthesis protein SbnB